MLIELDNAKLKIKQLEEGTQLQSIRETAISKADSRALQRPQTAAVGRTKKADTGISDDLDFDKELELLLAKNEKNLQELHQEFKEISKMAGEPTITIRKVGGRSASKADR